MATERKAFTLIELLVAITIIGLLIALLIPAVQAAREAAKRVQCVGNLRQLGIGLHNYQSTYGVFPFGVGADADGNAAQITSTSSRRFSLHSQILSFIEQGALFNQINFDVQPFYPDTSGDPSATSGVGPNNTAARTVVALFLCPSDTDRMPSRPWGQVNYRSCNGGSWSGRGGDGMFGQGTRVKPGDVRDGLSHTAAMSERVRGRDDYQVMDPSADLYRLAAPWTEEAFRDWCGSLSDAKAEEFPRTPSVANSGLTWLEGNMSWTRYNHLLPPGKKSCANGLTWNGVAMTASSRHSGGVGLLLGDGSTRFVRSTVDPKVWRALGTISGGETVSDDAS